MRTLWQRCPMCEGAGQIQATPGKKPAWYTLKIDVPPSGSQPGSIQINGRKDFELQLLMATYTDPRLLVTIQDFSGGEYWTISPNQNYGIGIVPITLIAGTAQLPFPIRPSYRIPKNNAVNFVATDQSGAPNTLNMVMYGLSILEDEAQQAA